VAAPAGALAVSGSTLGTQHLVATACHSGGRRDFYGVDLVDERSAIVVRVVIDPIEGGVVRLFPSGDPSDPGLVVRRDDCPTFRVEVAPTGSSVNFVEVMRAAVELDCRTRKGDEVRGELAWDECL
jgi:hypothetical protein